VTSGRFQGNALRIEAERSGQLAPPGPHVLICHDGHMPPADFGVGSWIERRARISPARPALITADRVLTYADLAARIRRLAHGLRELGVEHGDRVAWLGPNHPAFLEALFAAARLGAALAPVNHLLAVEERSSVLAETEPVILLEHAMPEGTPLPSVRQHVLVGGSAASPPEGALDYESLVAGGSDSSIEHATGLDEPVLLPHTSGTTGPPRVVILSHANVTWNAINFLTSADYRSDDVTIAIAPFFRTGGTGVNVLPILFAGGAVVIPARPTPDEILQLMEAHRVTVGFANPDLLAALTLAERWPSADLSAVRFVVTGGAPVPERLIHAFLSRGLPLRQGYGLTEAAPLALLLDPATAAHKPGAAGRPPLMVDVRIVDDGGAGSPPGETGELLIRGPNVMAGYWGRPEATARVLSADGWLRTGDAARIDDDGDVWIVDRIGARYRSGGRLIYPGDVERALMRHPAVVDAGVVGVPTHLGDTVGVAFVVLDPGATVTIAELLARCRIDLPAAGVPASITFVDALPRNAVGKLIRSELARLAADGSGAPPGAA
jgi:fatty-acyl-CoA synthase